MPSPSHPGTGEHLPLTCGNCGASVRAADVTCPACGVLLAAYQAPAGATGSDAASTGAPLLGDTSATRDVVAPVIPGPVAAPPPPPVPGPVAPPVRHRPRSQSPIGDALQRSRDSSATGTDGLASDAVADELAGMAADDSDLARAVEADLTGARVVFDGAHSAIETDQVDITHTEQGTPVVVAHEPVAPASAPQPAASRPVRATVARPAITETPVAEAVPVPEPGPPPVAPTTGGFTPATLLRWMPLVLIGCFMLGFGRSLPGFGGVIGFALVIGLIYVLIKVAAASSRKTTSMPRDTTWNQPRSRRRK